MISLFPDLGSWFGDHSGVESAAAKAKAAKLAAKLQHSDLGPLKPVSDFGAYDINGDGIITMDDCPFEHGTVAAKAWWQNVQVPFIKATMSHPDAIKYLDKYGDKFHGYYNGKPMLSGVSAKEVPGQGDFNYIEDRLMVTQDMSQAGASNVAGAIKAHIGAR